MHTAADTWTVARQIAFFRPADDRGKWHAKWLVTDTPVCGSAAELASDAIYSAVGDQASQIHPVVCRRCIRLSTPAGVSARGIATG